MQRMEHIGPPPRQPPPHRGGSSGRLSLSLAQSGNAVAAVRRQLQDKKCTGRKLETNEVPPPPRQHGESTSMKRNSKQIRGAFEVEEKEDVHPEEPIRVTSRTTKSDTDQSLDGQGKSNDRWSYSTEKKWKNETHGRVTNENDLELKDEEDSNDWEHPHQNVSPASPPPSPALKRSTKQGNKRRNQRSESKQNNGQIMYNSLLHVLQPNEITGQVVASQEEIRNIIFSPVPELTTLHCRVERSIDSIGNLLYSFVIPMKKLGSKGSKTKDHNLTLMMAQKRQHKFFSMVQSLSPFKETYVISMDMDDFRVPHERRSVRYFGKLQRCPEFECSVYKLFDAGCNAKLKAQRRGSVGSRLRNWLSNDAGSGLSMMERGEQQQDESDHTPENLREPRKEYAAIRFPGVTLEMHENEMFVAVPKVELVENALPSDTESDLEIMEQVAAQKARTMALTPNSPEESLANALGLFGVPDGENPFGPPIHSVDGTKKRPMVGQRTNTPVAPSVKNCDLVCDLDNDIQVPECATNAQGKYVCLSMGRLGQDRFEMVVGAPLSPFQAFGIALSRLDNLSNVKNKIAKYLI